jgi:nucleotide-binding universal stress UspA family protein
MVYKNILVAYDKSEPANHALEAALELVEGDPEAKVNVVSVLTSMEEAYSFTGFGSGLSSETGSAALDYETIAAIEETVATRQKDELTKEIGTIVPADQKDQATVDIEFAPSPAAGVLSYAEKKGSDIIVMGNRGLGALRGLLGSVSFTVLRSAPIPVLIVK